MSKRWLLVLTCLVVAVAGCGGSAGPPYDVSSEVVGDDTTQPMRVWAPVDEGSWPVVFAMPGISGRTSDFDQFGPALAREGVVVFATDYRTNGTIEGLAEDLGCGYSYARSVADEYGGDLTKPVTGLGYSFGAFWMLGGALHTSEGGSSPADRCVRDLPLPDVVVGVNGCYFTGQPVRFTTAGLDRWDTDVLLVAASADQNCPARESVRVAAALQRASFHVRLTMIRDANHFTPLFHDDVAGRLVNVPDSPDGEETVQAILDLIEANS